MKELRKYFVLVLFSIVLLFTACNNGGGEGADFDASLYYTKAEIDDNFYDKTATDSAIADVAPLSGPGNPQWLSNTTGWANRTTGWAVPEGANSVLVNVRIMAPLSNNITVYFGSAEAASNSWDLIAGTGNTILMCFNVSAKETVYAWTEVNSPGVDNVELAPVIWLR